VEHEARGEALALAAQELLAVGQLERGRVSSRVDDGRLEALADQRLAGLLRVFDGDAVEGRRDLLVFREQEELGALLVPLPAEVAVDRDLAARVERRLVGLCDRGVDVDVERPRLRVDADRHVLVGPIAGEPEGRVEAEVERLLDGGSDARRLPLRDPHRVEPAADRVHDAIAARQALVADDGEEAADLGVREVLHERSRLLEALFHAARREPDGDDRDGHLGQGEVVLGEAALRHVLRDERACLPDRGRAAGAAIAARQDDHRLMHRRLDRLADVAELTEAVDRRLLDDVAELAHAAPGHRERLGDRRLDEGRRLGFVARPVEGVHDARVVEVHHLEDVVLALGRDERRADALRLVEAAADAVARVEEDEPRRPDAGDLLLRSVAPLLLADELELLVFALDVDGEEGLALFPLDRVPQRLGLLDLVGDAVEDVLGLRHRVAGPGGPRQRVVLHDLEDRRQHGRALGLARPRIDPQDVPLALGPGGAGLRQDESDDDSDQREVTRGPAALRAFHGSSSSFRRRGDLRLRCPLARGIAPRTLRIVHRSDVPRPGARGGPVVLAGASCG
jgi:hypothetical protein